MTESTPSIAFIGGGNMAGAMVSGLIIKGHNHQQITVVETNATRATFLQNTFDVNVSSDLKEVMDNADVVVLAVKPQVLSSVLKQISRIGCSAGCLIVSIAAGINTSLVKGYLGRTMPVVRLMPNLGALSGVGMSGLFASAEVTATQKQFAAMIAEACGEFVEVEREADINAVTGLSGSGPAYFLLMMQGMIKAGIELGLDEKSAQHLVAQTALGAATLLKNPLNSSARLIEQVTSKGGTTASALNVLAERQFELAASEAVKAAHKRAHELGEPHV